MLNKAILMGRLTANPELKTTPQGTAVTSFTLAVERNYSKDEKQTDFINIVAWRNTAEFICKYFTKGQLVAVEGNIQTRKYTDKDGNKRIAFEILAEQVYFAEKKTRIDENTIFNEAQDITVNSQGFEEIEDDAELPF
jgi:single-strand DNA-binding protein